MTSKTDNDTRFAQSLEALGLENDWTAVPGDRIALSRWSGVRNDHSFDPSRPRHA